MPATLPPPSESALLGLPPGVAHSIRLRSTLGGVVTLVGAALLILVTVGVAAIAKSDGDPRWVVLISFGLVPHVCVFVTGIRVLCVGTCLAGDSLLLRQAQRRTQVLQMAMVTAVSTAFITIVLLIVIGVVSAPDVTFGTILLWILAPVLETGAALIGLVGYLLGRAQLRGLPAIGAK